MPRGGPGSDRGSYYPLPSDLDQDATRRGGPAGGTPPVQSLWAALVDPSHDGALSIGQDNTRLMVHIDDVGHARSLSLHKRHLVRDRLVRYRDSLLLDPTVPIPFPAALFIREKAIIVNLEAVRMIICANQCYVLSVPKVGEGSGVFSYSDLCKPCERR